jgi:hypothetical protein
VRLCAARGRGVDPRTTRDRPADAPTEPEPRRRTKPIPGAKRSQSPAPNEPNPRRRANPGVRLRFTSVRLRAGQGRGCRTSDRLRSTCQRPPLIIAIPGPRVLPIRGGVRGRLVTLGGSGPWGRASNGPATIPEPGLPQSRAGGISVSVNDNSLRPLSASLRVPFPLRWSYRFLTPFLTLTRFLTPFLT